MPHHAPDLTGEARCRGGMGPRDKPEGDNGSGRLRWCDGRKRSVNAVDREGRGHLLHATSFTSAWRFLPAESLMQPSGSRSARLTICSSSVMATSLMRAPPPLMRSAARHVGKEDGSTGRSWWWATNKK